ASSLCAYAQMPPSPFLCGAPSRWRPLHTSAQLLADGAQQNLGNITVVNKPGAGGATGVEWVAKAKPQDNLVVMGAVATHAVLPHLGNALGYDIDKDFKPLLLVARVPNVLVMSKERAEQLKLQSTSDLVAYAKANPDTLKIGSAGRQHRPYRR
nr:hypothetical protein [Staphylococcus epidermidis]